MIASTTVGPQSTVMSSTDAFGQWRETDIAAVTLAAGVYYAGVYYPFNSEYVLLGLVVPVAQAGLTYLTSQFNIGPSLAFPAASFGPNALVGPALFGRQVSTTAVPEPAT